MKRYIPIEDVYYPMNLSLYYKILMGRKDGNEYVLLGIPKQEIDARIKLLDLPLLESK